ncbi:MAG: hypothetical protein NZ922_00295 [Candidatus Methanomethyliaceae archaeon]|nr:hypothetical protein [Candidatus Methanomethyliaceae archaeon]MDW7970485.1 Trm112 family protein [Nitrososphaerota archaeon]
MKRRLLDILACPMCKYYPLELIVFEEEEEIEEGLLICNNCNRWYPIIEAIPHMLPDDLRDEKEDLEFLKKWQERAPEKILKSGKPFNLKG